MYTEARIAPFINTPFLITAQTGVYPSGGEHKGLDLATSTGNSPLYSMVTGKILLNNYNSSYGNYIIMQDENTGVSFLYAHMQERSSLNVGDSVKVGQQVGIEGATGEVTGPHVHVEQQNLKVGESWKFDIPASEQIHACEFMGLPYEVGIWCIYNGIPIPPKPTIPIRKNKFPWVLYANKIRNKY